MGERGWGVVVIEVEDEEEEEIKLRGEGWFGLWRGVFSLEDFFELGCFRMEVGGCF